MTCKTCKHCVIVNPIYDYFNNQYIQGDIICIKKLEMNEIAVEARPLLCQSYEMKEKDIETESPSW